MRSFFVWMIVVAMPLAWAGHGGTAAGRCGPEGPALGLVELVTPEGVYYVDDRGPATGNGLRVYVETNGVWFEKPPGVYAGEVVAHDLQRGSATDDWTFLFDAEVCADEGDWEPDLLLT